MDKKTILEAIKKIKDNSQKRNFKQTYDLIINLKNLNLKKPEEQVDTFAQLHFSKGKPVRLCALIGPELKDEASKNCKTVIDAADFDAYAKDKKKVKKLAEEHDYFIAQATVMPKVAAAFGRVLGPRGKMPNPKVGCVVPPKTNLKVLAEKLQNTVRLSAKTTQLIHCVAGSEEMKDEEVADNVLTIYNHLIHSLPSEKQNIKSVFLKLTMGKPEKLQ